MLRPLNLNVIVKPIREAPVSASGILLPDAAGKEQPQRGKIVALGSYYTDLISASLKVGDTVLFKKYAPEEVKVGDEIFLVIAESDLLAVVE